MQTKKTTKHETNSKEPEPTKRCIKTFPTMP